MKGADKVAVTVWKSDRGQAVRAFWEAIISSQHAENVVERMVLHHHDGEVLNLRNLIRPGRYLRIGK
jgi:hypothetical protein